ncbi:MAG: Gfo/Idh/MocA family oxidoreductase [Phycisphaerae bacterium]|nr:Gfo/Idh/MocA family oxidoreductase [Phycisphaerae bacterium]
MKRREFLEAGIASGVGLLMTHTPQATQAQTTSSSDTLDVAIIGVGEQGRTLIQCAAMIPNVRFRAVCDIWEYRRTTAKKYLATFKQEVNEYADYRQMLDKEKGVQAVIVATPDFVHPEHANACMQAGRHVYCEAMMANSADAARSMVKTMRQTGKLLQIGYQRRSNPRYAHALSVLLDKAHIAGQLTHVGAQWAHRVKDDYGWPRKFAIPDDQLREHGYTAMKDFRNWRSFKKYGSGPFGEFASHQIDVTNWFLGGMPKSVVATGGIDYYKDRQWCDNVTAVLEYPTEKGTVRAAYQLLTTTSAGGGNYEHFMGTECSIRMSQDRKWTKVFREPYAPEWDKWIALNYVVKEVPPGQAKAAQPGSKPVDPNEARSQESGQITAWNIPVVVDKPPWQLHLENFFDAVRGKAKLNCPADVAFPAEILVFKVNEAIDARKAIDLKPEDFAV